MNSLIYATKASGSSSKADEVTIIKNDERKFTAQDIAINGDLTDLVSERGVFGTVSKTLSTSDFSKVITPSLYKVSGNDTSKGGINISSDASLSVIDFPEYLEQKLDYGRGVLRRRLWKHSLDNDALTNPWYPDYGDLLYSLSYIYKTYNHENIPVEKISNIKISKGTNGSNSLDITGYCPLSTVSSTYFTGSEKSNVLANYYNPMWFRTVYGNSSVSVSLSVEERAGKDVYIIAYTTGLEIGIGFQKNILFSLSTYPTSDQITSLGIKAYRCIGGFHCLCADVGTILGHPLSGYAKGDIIPNSIWTLNHRPVSDPEGMVWVPEINKWVDIYLPSWNGSKLISKYQGVIADGASSPSFNGSKFAEYAALAKKELISYDEFTVVAKGSNEGTSINGASDPNTAGGHVDTAGRRMISNYGLEDCCGVLWQWSRTLFEGGATSPTASSVWRNGAGEATYTEGSMRYYLDNYGWYKESVYNPTFDSQQYGSCVGLLRRARLGGLWGVGSYCGSRAVFCRNFSAFGWSSVSARLVSSPRV